VQRPSATQAVPGRLLGGVGGEQSGADEPGPDGTDQNGQGASPGTGMKRASHADRAGTRESSGDEEVEGLHPTPLGAGEGADRVPAPVVPIEAPPGRGIGADEDRTGGDRTSQQRTGSHPTCLARAASADHRLPGVTTVVWVAVEFTPLHRADFPLLGEWMAAPHVEPWWREAYDPASIEARYGPAVDGTDPTELFIVRRDGQPVGFIQRYLIDDNPDWKRSLEPAAVPEPALGVDYMIGREDLLGQGLGPAIIDRCVREAWRRYPHVVAAAADVDPHNRRSWRALEKCGFRRVWSGTIVSDDPSDNGPAYVYVRMRD
jgi:aminoglycoside 6'-N-acetyltransferase